VNLSRSYGDHFFSIASLILLRTTTTEVSLSDANQALAALRAGRVEGAAVLVP